MFVLIETIDDYNNYPERETRMVGIFDTEDEAKEVRECLKAHVLINNDEELYVEVEEWMVDYDEFKTYRWYIFNSDDPDMKYTIA